MIELEIVYKEIASEVDVQPFIDSLALLTYPFMFEAEDTAPELNQLMIAAEPFIKGHKLNITLWKRIARKCTKDFFSGHDDIDSFHDRLIEARVKLKNDSSLTLDQFNLVKDWIIWYQSNSDASRKRFLKLTSSITSPLVRKLYAADAAEDESLADKQWQFVEQVQAIVQAHTGKPASKLKKSQGDKLKAEDPDAYNEYSVLRKKINDLTKEIVQNMCSRQGGIVDLGEVINELNNLGADHDLPETFRGKIDGQYKYYTVFDEPLEGTPSGKVLMNARYKKGSSEYVCKCRSAFADTDKFSSIYTTNARASSSVAKFAAVTKALPKLAKARAKWQKELKSKDQDIEELATLTEIIYQTQGRVGTKGNKTKGETTYGLSTLLKKHFKFSGEGVIIKYKGKGQGGKTIQQVHTIKGDTPVNRLLIKNLKKFCDDQEELDDPIFFNTGTGVNWYLREHLGLPMTAHKFRTLKGTELMAELLSKVELPPNPSEAQVKNAMVKCAEQVGAMRGHYTMTKEGDSKINPMTSIKNYIDPNIIAQYFKKYGVRPPRAIETLINKFNRVK